MTEYDQGYKQLFSHARMVEDLLRGFVAGEWLEQLDFDTLDRVNATFVSPEYQKREGDIIWRIQSQAHGGEIYIYLLLEFQSTVDEEMALRMLVYVGMLYQEIVKNRKPQETRLLPPVLPLVLYNGKKQWNSAQALSQRIAQAPLQIREYQPEMRYLLIDESRLLDSDLAVERNLAAAMFSIERSRTPQDLENAIGLLIKWLGLGISEAQNASLHKAFLTWLRRVVLPAKFPDIEFGDIEELQEVKKMLKDQTTGWTYEWKRQERVQTLRDNIMDIMMTRFDAAPQDITSILHKIEDDTYLKTLHHQAITVKSVDDFRQLLG